MNKLSKIYQDTKKTITRLPEKFFLLSTLTFGLFFIILIPPFQVPDELIHFTRAYEVSELKVSQPHEVKGVNHLGSMLPVSILKTYKGTSLHQIADYPDVPQAKKYSLGYTKDALNIPLNKSDRIFFDTGSSPSYFPFLYIPQALTVAVLSIFNAPIVLMLYATRLAGLLLWILLIFIAFRFVKSADMKLSLIAVLLLPMFISQASASTDPLINGLIVVYVAMLASFISKKVAPRPIHIIMLVAILSLMTLSKPVYAIFGLLLFLLPKAIADWKTAIKTALLICVPFVAYIAWAGITKVSGSYYFDAIAVSKADPSNQLHYVLPNVINFIEPLANTLLLSWGDGVMVSLVGMFGKLDTPLPLIFVLLGYVIVIVAMLAKVDGKKTESSKNGEIQHNVKSVALSVLLVFGYIIGVYLAMYIVSTPPHEKIITGIQGRYLLPLIPFGVLFATRGWITFRKRSSYQLFLIITPLILLIASVCVVYIRYYVKYP